jgi:hypothetical protein
MTRGSVSWGGRSTTGAAGALCVSWTQGLQRIQHGFLGLGTLGLVHLYGLATDWDTLCRWDRVDILGFPA